MKRFCWLAWAAFLGAGGLRYARPAVVLTGDIRVDAPNAIAHGPPRDKVLWQYRLAAAEMREGKFEQAKPLLDDALLTLGGIFGKDARGQKAAAPRGG